MATWVILGAEYDVIVYDLDATPTLAILAGLICGLLVSAYFLVRARRNRPAS